MVLVLVGSRAPRIHTCIATVSRLTEHTGSPFRLLELLQESPVSYSLVRLSYLGHDRSLECCAPNGLSCPLPWAGPSNTRSLEGAFAGPSSAPPTQARAGAMCAFAPWILLRGSNLATRRTHRFCGSQGGIRTPDRSVNSRTLLPLSYLGTSSFAFRSILIFEALQERFNASCNQLHATCSVCPLNLCYPCHRDSFIQKVWTSR